MTKVMDMPPEPKVRAPVLDPTLGEGKTAMSFPYPIVQALKEKLPELEQRDVELALNCILAQLANALVQGLTL
jgi:hypothetical protein